MSNKGLFGPIHDDNEENARVETPVRERKISHIDHRGNALNDLVTGNVEDKALLWIDPAECRMWGRHNRRYDLLTIENCRDLVEGIKSQGRQEIPAVVRAVKDDPGHKYEIIAGARRHWAISWLREHNYPNFKYLVDVRDLTDEQAFRLSDMENRDREDISDYERALDYKNAIDLYYNGNASDMAARIGYTNANLSYLLKLADLPVEVLAAFSDVTQITINNGRTLAPLLKDPKIKKKVLTKATEISRVQKERIGAGEKLIPAREVISLLKSVSNEKVLKGPMKRYATSTGKTAMDIVKASKSELQLIVYRDKNLTKEQLLEAFSEMLGEYL